jgi:hypothetical protein
MGVSLMKVTGCQAPSVFSLFHLLRFIKRNLQLNAHALALLTGWSLF